MSNVDFRKVTLFLLWISLLAFAMHHSKPIWMLFAALSAYQLFQLFKPKQVLPPDQGQRVTPMNYGVLGHHYVDGPDEDPCYGMYIEIQDAPVFLDIKQDELLDKRVAYARSLAADANSLVLNLESFRSRNPQFSSRHIASIGLHSTNTKRGEVFWNPDGYTQLLDRDFIDP